MKNRIIIAVVVVILIGIFYAIITMGGKKGESDALYIAHSYIEAVETHAVASQMNYGAIEDGVYTVAQLEQKGVKHIEDIDGKITLKNGVVSEYELYIYDYVVTRKNGEMIINKK